MESRHEQIARIALAAGARYGLALAGGYAVSAHGMGNRPSGDVDLFTSWEPAHGELIAQPRRPEQRYAPGTRAYLSAGLPGAQWWVAGRAVDRAEDADVELNEVERLYTGHGMWGTALGR
jgi:hypothetical protein